MAKTLQEVMQEHPNLCSYGYRAVVPSFELAKMDEWRARLAADTEQFEKALSWCLRYLVLSKRVNKRYTSYGLKHICEPFIGYVTNGTFIAAFLAAGGTVFPVLSSPNPHFNVTDGSVRGAEAAIQWLHP
jgi:hypothetical protein